MKKFKGHFSGPSNPSYPSNPSNPSTRPIKYSWYVCFKKELLHPQNEKSRTCSNFENKFRLSNHNVPSGSSANPYERGRRPSLMGRVGRSRKVSFKFLHTLWVNRLCIGLLIYEIKIVTNILMGLKISW